LSEAREIDLPRQPVCGAVARRVVERQYRDRLAPRTLDDLKLVVSELVDNAYTHGQGQIRLRLSRAQASVRVEVMDEGRDAVIRIREPGGRGGGHGLRLVDHLCSGWGALAGSTHVWAELAADPAQM
jgi:anti-sigma regulatory factor (Ser/Thr protein kinase)